MREKYKEISKIENFLNLNSDSYRFYAARGEKSELVYFDDLDGRIIYLLKNNLPSELSNDEYHERIKQSSNFDQDLNGVTVRKDSISRLNVLYNYACCCLTARNDARFAFGEAYTRYYLIKEDVGKTIYDIAKKSIENEKYKNN